MNEGRIEWEVVAFFAECAHAALGDPRLLDDESWLGHALPYVHVRRSGYGMIYGLAECDGLPLEIGRYRGHIVAVRMEFTSDVAELEASGEGTWQPLGRLRIGDRGAVAGDHQHLDGRLHRVPLRPGWYLAEAFEHAFHHLGIRLIKEASLGTEPPPVSVPMQMRRQDVQDESKSMADDGRSKSRAQAYEPTRLAHDPEPDCSLELKMRDVATLQAECRSGGVPCRLTVRT